MKKLWKYEWSFYGVLLLVFVLIILLKLNNGLFYWGSEIDYMDLFDVWIDEIRMDEFESIISQTIYFGLSNLIEYLVFTMIVIKIGCNLAEASRSGREFLEQLPVNKKSRQGFRYIMNLLFMAIVIIISMFCLYFQVKKSLAVIDIRIDWLGKALVGLAITLFAYLIMIYGFLTLIENVIVTGFGKIVGIIAGLAIFNNYMNYIYSKATQGKQLFEKIYGFFSLDTAGGQYIVRDSSEGSTYWDWYTNSETVKYFCNDKICEVSSRNTLARFLNFSKPDIMIGQILCYLLLASILLGTAYILGKKQEVSKQGFYFVAAKYMVAIIIGITFCMMCIHSFPYIWYKCVVIVASVCVAALFSYWMTPDRIRYFEPKAKRRIE